MHISKFSIKRPTFTLVSMFLVIILGIVSLMNIPLKLIPDINPPVGVVVANYFGASPNEVSEKVTKPLEQSLSTLPGLKTMSSTSQEGASFILLQFSWTTSIDEIENEIVSRINQTQITDDAEAPRFLKFDPSQFPVIQLSLSMEGDEKGLQELAEGLVTELNKVEGVANVNLSGVVSDEIKVELDQEKLKEYALTQTDIVNILRANAVSLPGNTIESEGKELTTRVISSLNSVDDLEELAITIDPILGEKVVLADLAQVKIVPESQKTITRANMEPAMLVSVLQESDANTANVSQSFQKELEKKLAQKKYKNVQADILFDQGDYVKVAIGNITSTLLLGGLFAMIVLFFFLRNVKSPLIIGIAIPYSVIVTFVLMYFSDFSLNILTLGGLALGIGMLVDNSIVVIENIYRHLSMGKEPKVAAEEGTKEIGTAIIASTLTTVAVFLPVVFITGLIGELFTEFAVTIAFSLFASLVVALTVVPMLASRFLKRPIGDLEKKRMTSRGMLFLEKATRWSLSHRLIVLLVTLVMFGVSLFGLFTVGTEFIPKSDEGFFTIKMKLENGTPLKETQNAVTVIEKELAEEPDVDVYVSLIGSTQEKSFRGGGSTNEAEIYVKMVGAEERERSTFEFVDDTKQKIETKVSELHPEAVVKFNLQSSSGSTPNTLQFHVKDTDKGQLDKAVDKIADALVTLKDVTEVSTDVSKTIEELQITIDKEKAFEEGLVPVQIASTVNDVTRGTRAIQLIDQENTIYPVNVGYNREFTNHIESLRDLPLKTQANTFVPLDEVADIEIGEGPLTVRRIDQQHAVQFTVKYVSSTNLGAISKKIDEEVAGLGLSDETDLVYSGDKELLESAMDQMLLAFVLALTLIYFVMAAQFESFKYPFVIMFTVPLMVIGVAIGLFFTNTPIGITAIIGIIVLAGIVVNNAIVIVDYINRKKEEGMGSYEAIVVAVKDRTRPVMMTASTTILGLLPLAFGIGEGSEINQPMGITVIGGLLSSTLLTLFVIPVVYSLFDKETRRRVEGG
ncbi:efflux RND transporter permease subunit [Bacillus timonensis]|uniref:Efflux RND transporter permease subunit n=1 Tax=Bacillus timonensis TaxID=1033734 RepID=A0A4S3PKX0_9BACI|nr:efflux RND transporter permease subunit [Bacillus timonensis]THE09978.1 efflux RND transporter permease subunit [Bacillus timonensis]